MAKTKLLIDTDPGVDDARIVLDVDQARFEALVASALGVG